ncbi:MAG TPA: ATP-binding protein, partial [Burkholderiaceae bacterium]|nr:ATP-binding protein [Burkholderiaceae bacterium]
MAAEQHLDAAVAGRIGLVKSFSITASVLMLAGTLLLAFGYKALGEQMLVEQGSRANVTLTQAIYNAIADQLQPVATHAMNRSSGAATAPATLNLERLDAIVRRLMQGTSVHKIEIFDTRGVAIYSTEPHEIGADESHAPSIRRALDGETVSVLIYRDIYNASEAKAFGHNLLNSHVPVRGADGRVALVFELYDDLPPLTERIDSTSWRAFFCIATTMLLLYLALLAVVGRGAGVIRRQQKALRKAQSALIGARDSAEQASRTKSAFLANMSHEIRTPMHGVLGLTRLLLSTPLNDEQTKYARSIQRSGEALLRIINDILDLSKIEAGKLQLDERDFDLRHVIDDTLQLMSPTASQKGLQLSAQIPAELRTQVRGDPMRLQQVLCNLVGNALKFTAHGSVRVTVCADGEPGADELRRFRFEVIDTGIGLERASLKSIFEPFAQADSSTSRRYGGSGLGLAIVDKLVKAMAGSVEVESTVGVGSAFRFTCQFRRRSRTTVVAGPIETPEALDDGTLDLQTPATTHGRRQHALLVEDNLVNQVVAQAVLSSQGFAVTIAHNGREAVDRWKKDRF